MFTEEELLPLSALQHLLFCERRAALVHLERIWEENIFTVDGSHLHKKVTEGGSLEARGDLRIGRGLYLRSLRLGLMGKADVVEFHRVKRDSFELGCDSTEAKSVGLTRGSSDRWVPFPVEYKRGRLRREEGYEIQLCAQAICLEEMLGVEVPAGAIFYGKQRRRLEVLFDAKLRNETEAAALRLHELVRSGKTPTCQFEKKCQKCSLLNLCMPKATGSHRSVRSYLARALADSEEA